MCEEEERYGIDDIEANGYLKSDSEDDDSEDEDKDDEREVEIGIVKRRVIVSLRGGCTP